MSSSARNGTGSGLSGTEYALASVVLIVIIICGLFATDEQVFRDAIDAFTGPP